MVELWRRAWCLATGLLVPALVLASPAWLRLDGVGPDWAVLWLLPWALVDGPVSGALVGAGLGLLLDASRGGGITVIPALAVLGWWWGRLGRRSIMQRSVSLALLALVGSLGVGLSLLLQQLLLGQLAPAGWQLLWAQVLLTGLVAPLLCSLELLLWRQQLPGVR